jgi:hypothetical protein
MTTLYKKSQESSSLLSWPESVAADHLYILELVDQNYCWEQLTDKELDALDQFEEDKEEWETKQPHVKKQGQGSDFSN